MDILTFGNSLLRQVCEPIDNKDYQFGSSELEALISNMFAKMYEEDGVGLAAPQIGVSKRLFIVDILDGNQYIFINPRITRMQDEYQCIEGCLSFPGVFVDVLRYKKIFIKAQDTKGQVFKMKVQGLLAQAIQHELDHLDGILLSDVAIDKNDLSLKLSKNNLKEFW
jgi:peptide deformylase